MNKQSKLTKAVVVATALSMPAFAYASQPADFANVATAAAHAKRTIDLDNAVALDMSDIINLGRAIWQVIKTKAGDGGAGSGTTCTTTCSNDGSGGSTCTTTCTTGSGGA